MATPEEMAQTMINNLAEKTGKNLSEWISTVSATKLEKHGEIVKHLKSAHNVTHGYANLIAAKFREKPEEGSKEEDLVSKQYKGKSSLHPIYEMLIKTITAFGDDVEIAPKKAYVSIRRNKQFALIQPSTKTRLDVGINLKGKDPEGKLEASGSFNTMVSHRVKLTEIGEVDEKLTNWLREAYDQS